MAKNDDFDYIRPNKDAAEKREQDRRRQQKDRQAKAARAKALQAREVERQLAAEREAMAEGRRLDRRDALTWMLIRGFVVCALSLLCWRAETKNMIDPTAVTWVTCICFSYLSFWLGDLARLYKEG